MNVRRKLVVALATAALGSTALLASAGPAAAAETPVGNLTAEFRQGNCSDFGANVYVTVTNGVPGATYVARSFRDDSNWNSAKFTLDASGHGAGNVWGVINDDYHGNGNFTGTATIIVTSGAKQGNVTTFVDCPGGKGD
jgi:hypothetical protein